MKTSFINYLNSKKCFKLILGANNENYEEITKLVALYSLAGCRFFDINASVEAINAAKKGLEYSKKEDCFLCISVGGKNDPHISKCKINQQICKHCGQCIDECIQNAITRNDNSIRIEEKKCIGCSRCQKKCPYNAIERYYNSIDFNKKIIELKNYCDCIELHIASDDIHDIDEKWDFLCKNFDSILSISVNRSIFSDETLINQLKKMLSKSDLNKVMIQADGFSMTGGNDDYNSTLQAVSCADLILKAGVNCPIVISGGTNSKSKMLSNICNVDISGVAIGSYARKIVKNLIDKDDFLYNKETFELALKIAKQLVESVNF